MVNVAAMFAQPEERAIHEPWVTRLAADLQEDDRGAYVGFLADEGEERIRAAYPGATWDRLTAVKATYDPDNVFRLNENIPPA
jgi:FAD/FMN-containing dehydrogenase